MKTKVASKVMTWNLAFHVITLEATLVFTENDPTYYVQFGERLLGVSRGILSK